MPLFEKLAGAFQKVFRDIRGYGKLSEKNIQDALREVRLALLEADVNLNVVREFTARVREKALGRDVLDSITPGQQFIKHVYDELVALLGGEAQDFRLMGRPAAVMMIGLHGSGKTTTSAKLAARWKKSGKNVLLVACDIRRPAAVDQLRILAQQVGVPILAPEPGESVPQIGRRAMQHARDGRFDIAIFDTGGRFQIDEELVAELRELKAVVDPSDTVLVLDAAIGQESVHVAERFHRDVGLTGIILTKLDGDARGGAALSVRHATGCPVLMAGVGEKVGDLEPFHPARMASRILGMGDVVSLVEKAQAAIDEKAAEDMEQRLLAGEFTLEDFLAQIRQVKKIGSLGNLLELLPGAGRLPPHMRESFGRDAELEMKKHEAIIQSMTPDERRRPQIINASRRRRIAAGSGTRVQDVNELLKKFELAREMARRLKTHRKRLMRSGR
ncbi:MAG: signal recognition particle protein [Kiritimatiellae bacterium]|nr:signal recognition particle protein [Kiritimatiellia bacterium]MDW8458793.1 signal recognition particle protein [Verrucomicrobiota bacterium]